MGAKDLVTEGYVYIYMLMTIGLLSGMGFMAIGQRILTKDKTYGFWSIYLFSNALFFSAELNRQFKLNLIPAIEQDLASNALPWPTAFQYLTSAAYFLFIKSFLKLPAALNRFVNFSIIISALFFISSCIIVWHYFEWRAILFADALMLVTSTLLAITVFRIIKNDIVHKKLIFIGSLGVLISAIIAVIIEVFELQRSANPISYPIVIFALGVLWELCFFSMALSQRTLFLQVENQELKSNYTIQLEIELKERLQTIKEQTKTLEEQRLKTIEEGFNRKLAEIEVSALRSQMNPHFIFNCLNSIKLYTLENNSEKASEYLTKFSRLMRLVLEHSRSSKVLLSNELETLNLYIELEAMRFKNKFTFEINVNDNVQTSLIEIPSMIIQPYIENAIWHGLMHLKGSGHLKLEMNCVQSNLLNIIVEDNGVGRQTAEEIKSKSATTQKSYGLNVTQERLKHINEETAEVKIIDLFNAANEPIGTKVDIYLPI